MLHRAGLSNRPPSIIHARRFPSDQGQGLVEYALILSLVAVVAIVVIALFGTTIQTTFCQVVSQLGDPSQARACVQGGMADGQRAPDQAPIEAIINPTAVNNVQNVVFKLNGATVATESNPRYCMAGGNETCNPYNFAALSPGSYVLEIVVNMRNGQTTRTVLNFTR